MFIKNGICYAGKMEEGIKVIAVKPLMGMMMLVTFSTGEKRLFDATLLKGAAFEPLMDEIVFFFTNAFSWSNNMERRRDRCSSRDCL